MQSKWGDIPPKTRLHSYKTTEPLIGTVYNTNAAMNNPYIQKGKASKLIVDSRKQGLTPAPNTKSTYIQ